MRTVADLQKELPSSLETGLAPEQVAQSRQRFGANHLTPLPREPLWKKFLEKFDEPIIKILLAAALLSMIVDLFKPPFEGVRFTIGGIAVGLVVLVIAGAYFLKRSEIIPSLLFASAVVLFPVGLATGHASFDGLAVMVAVILATGVAFLSEYKSDREFEILNAQKESLQVKVLRGSAIHALPLEEVVVGDVVYLEMGDEIPADGRLAKATDLYVDQSLMTGESEPVRKQARADDTADGPEQPGCLYRGTQIVDGVGQLVVTEVGDATYLGQIARRLSAQEEEEEEEGPETEQKRVKRKLTVSKELTPLQLKLQNLAELISKVGYVAAAAIFVALLVQGLIKGEVRWPNSQTRLITAGKHSSQININAIAFSPDGRMLASAAWTAVGENFVGEIKLSDAHTGKELRTLHDHHDFVTAMVFSPDGRYLTTASRDATIILWDARSGRKVHHFQEGLLSEPRLDAGHTKAVNRIAFSPNSRRLASASSDGTAKVWDITTGKLLLTFTGHRGEVFGVAFSPDGTQVASCGEDRTIRVWDADTGKEQLFKHKVWIQFAKDKIEKEEEHPGIVTPDENPARQVVFSPDGERLATLTSFGDNLRQAPGWLVHVWDARTGQLQHTLDKQGGPAVLVAFADKDTIVAGKSGFHALRWNVNSRETELTRSMGMVTGLMAFNPGTGQFAWTVENLVELPVGPDDFAAVLLASGAALLSYFMYMVIIIVVAVPEGLPMSVTVSLALAMRKMTRANSLVRQLVACETIGSATVICSDKTGTLTQNKMRVVRLCHDGQVKDRGTPEWKSPTDSELCNLQSAICNPMGWIAINAAVNSTAHIEEKEGELVTIGNSTEGALLQWLHEGGVEYQRLRLTYEPLYQIHFSSERKRMTTVIRTGNRLIALVKGAPEWVLEQSGQYLDGAGQPRPFDEQSRQTVQEQLRQAASQAMRTLAFGFTFLPDSLGHDEDSIHAEREHLEKELMFAGFVAIRDPLRDDVKDAVNECRQAGIDVKMITGDNLETARAIGAEIGLLDKPDAVVLTSQDFNAMTDDQIKECMPRLTILARARPLDKFRMVKLLQDQGEVVAVTGDGTNDAPALKKADVGLAMGKAGTEVAKEASKIVLLDDAFSTIVKAVHWGRSLYENIQRFIQFQLTINVSALVIAFLGPFFNVKPPFTILQLLWINVIMDTFAAIALCSEPPRPGLMKQKPKRRDENILTREMMRTILTTAGFFIVVMMTLLLILENSTWLRDGGSVASKSFPELTYWQVALFFSVYVFFQVWNEINCRSLTPEVSGVTGVHRNPIFLSIVGLIVLGQIVIVTFGGEVFEVARLGPLAWLLIALFTSSVLLYAEIARRVRLKLARG